MRKIIKVAIFALLFSCNLNVSQQQVNELVETIKMGGIVNVEPGTYYLPEIILTGKRDLVLQAADTSNIPVFRSATGRMFAVRGGSSVSIKWIHFITDNNFRLELFGSNLSIESCKFTGHQPKFAAILTGGENIKILNNYIELKNAGGTQDHGIYLNVGRGRTLTKNVEISGNTIIGPKGYGIHVWEQSESSGTEWSMSDIVIKDNVIKASRMRSGLIVAHGSGGSISNVDIANNRTSGNFYAGFVVRNGRDISLVDNVASERIPVEVSREADVEQLGNSWQQPPTDPPTDPPPDPPNDGKPGGTLIIRDGLMFREGRAIFKVDSLSIHGRNIEEAN